MAQSARSAVRRGMMKSRTPPATAARVPSLSTDEADAPRLPAPGPCEPSDQSSVADALLEVAVRLNAADTEEAVVRTVTLAATRLCGAESAHVGRLVHDTLLFDSLHTDGHW